jgi:hypothetical protein
MSDHVVVEIHFGWYRAQAEAAWSLIRDHKGFEGLRLQAAFGVDPCA